MAAWLLWLAYCVWQKSSAGCGGCGVNVALMASQPNNMISGGLTYVSAVA